MSAPINLNRVRKQKARAAKAANADANALRFGRRKAEKEADQRAKDLAAKHLDGHKRET